MYLRRVQIKNFRNFGDLDVRLRGDAVLVGENRVGKSNFLFALRLVLDAGLPDTARQLKQTDIWDGCTEPEPTVEVHLDFVDFDKDPDLLALLTDYRIAEDYQLARLSYSFRKKVEPKESGNLAIDYEFLVYGGGVETRYIRNDVRNRICLNLLPALRDAEAELAHRQTSPLRLPLDDAYDRVSQDDLTSISSHLGRATAELGALPPVKEVEEKLRTDISKLAGQAQDINVTLAFAPSDPRRIFKSIGLFIDDGKRSIADASLGSANLALIAMRLAEYEWLKDKKKRNYNMICIEEPEAHLHPHLQRQIFRQLFQEGVNPNRGLIMTTHSPNIASVSPLKSIVLLRATQNGTLGHSLADLQISDDEVLDLQRYITSTRADLFFSRGIIFVEGDAEVALLPVFAQSMRKNLDELGIAVCNVAGVNFIPYVKLAAVLAIPYVVITDWDPLDGTKPPLGVERALNIVSASRQAQGKSPLTPEQKTKCQSMGAAEFRAKLKTRQVFLNTSTLEVEVTNSPKLKATLLSVLEDANFGAKLSKRIADWKGGQREIDPEQLLSMIATIGKGRLASRLAKKSVGLEPPEYIKDAIEDLVRHV